MPFLFNSYISVKDHRTRELSTSHQAQNGSNLALWECKITNEKCPM
ncbi:hypothetical protein GGU45_002446 [Niabella hirudinis]